jgi:hypothetical protein
MGVYCSHLTAEQRLRVISGFRRDVDKIWALLGYYAASCGNCLPTFRDNVSVPYSRAKSPSRKERKPATYNVDGFCLVAVITPTNCYPARTFQNLRYRLLAFFLSYLNSWPVKMGPIRCPETSLNNYHTTPRNIPEERRYLQHRGESLKSKRNIICIEIKWLFYRIHVMVWEQKAKLFYVIYIDSIRGGEIYCRRFGDS